MLKRIMFGRAVLENLMRDHTMMVRQTLTGGQRWN